MNSRSMLLWWESGTSRTREDTTTSQLRDVRPESNRHRLEAPCCETTALTNHNAKGLCIAKMETCQMAPSSRVVPTAEPVLPPLW